MVAAVVNNNTDQEAVVDVKLEVGGPLMADLLSPDLQTVTIPAGGRQRVEFHDAFQEFDRPGKQAPALFARRKVRLLGERESDLH